MAEQSLHKLFEQERIAHKTIQANLEKKNRELSFLYNQLKEHNKNLEELVRQRTEESAIREAEKELKQSEQRWRFALEGSGAGVWEYDFILNEHYYTKQYAEILGYTEKEINTEYNWLENVHPDDRKRAKENERRFHSGQKDQHSLTYRLKCKDGSYKWILDRGMIIEKDQNGKPLKSIGTHTDITAIKETEIELSQTANRLTTLISNLNSGVLLEDESRRVVLANQAFCDMFGVSDHPGMLKGADCTNIAGQVKAIFKDADLFEKQIDLIVQQKERVLSEEIPLADGRVFERDSIPIKTGNNYLGHLWLYTDITGRKQADDAIRRSEEKYRKLIENMNLGLLEVNNEECIVYANQSFCKMSGYDREELIGKVASLFVKGESLKKVREKNNSRRLGISDTYELAIKNKSGELKWWLISGAPIVNDAGELTGSIGIHLDITQQKILEHQLREAKQDAEQSSKAKEIFLASMSHEIRTPMNAVIGMGKQLQKTKLEPQQKFYLGAINSAADNLLVIINDILDFSKIEAGKLSLEKIGFSLTEIITHCVNVLEHKADEKGLAVHTRIDKNIAEALLGDPYRLNQVILNLLSNAIKFTEKGKISIDCSLYKAEDSLQTVRIVVKDTGVGMTEEFTQNLFNKFTQEDESISR
ncbi:MAG TPA: PAS domain S-box protein, partial [Chitinophagaceae bacterium]|nr:PAS domain S-box protein [Chitinophagaceae bacterium]